jgi:Cytochrome P460
MLGRIVFLIAAAASIAGAQDDPQYTNDGMMRLPANYREWVFLSSGLGMTYGPAGQTNAQGNPRFDNVFVSPSAYKSFLKTGTWPDKTSMILEIRDSDSHVSINNGGRVQTSLAAIEVHVKDTRRFKGGWAFFAFDKSDIAKLIPASANCYSCHAEHGAVDTTFVQFYPTLIEIAKQKGTLKP